MIRIHKRLNNFQSNKLRLMLGGAKKVKDSSNTKTANKIISILFNAGQCDLKQFFNYDIKVLNQKECLKMLKNRILLK